MNKKLICMLFVLLSLMLTSCLFDDEEEEWSAAKVCPELGTNAKGMPNRGTFTDERDGRVYKYTTIGDQVWMAENLKYELPYPYSMCYGKEFCYRRNLTSWDTVMICKTEDSKLAEIGQRMNTTCTTNECIADEYCEKYGRYYNLIGGRNGDQNPIVENGLINRALVDTLCPKGWHVPSKADAEYLRKIVENHIVLEASESSFLDNSLYVETNDCGFNSIPMSSVSVVTGNLRERYETDFEGLSTAAHYGLSTAQSDFYVYVLDISREIYIIEDQGMPVIRCLKD